MTQNLKEFLKSLVDDIENDKLNDNELKIIGEFYMKYKFNNEQLTFKENEKDYIKYLSLGWYIYSIILDKKDI